MRPRSRLRLALGLLPLLLAASAARAQRTTSRVGAILGAGTSGAPLGEIAQRRGMVGIPGRDFEARIFFGSPRHEWSLGGTWDQYRLNQPSGVSTQSQFDYRSANVVLGYSTLRPTAGVPVSYGIDLGVSEFRASSSSPSYYTGEPESSRTPGRAVLLNLTYGVEIPLQSVSVVPRLRLSTNYPDFGGGDGYSALHRESDLGFKASFGVSVKAAARLRDK